MLGFFIYWFPILHASNILCSLQLNADNLCDWMLVLDWGWGAWTEAAEAGCSWPGLSISPGLRPATATSGYRRQFLYTAHANALFCESLISR